jgi:hypothetical protein
MSDPDPPPTNTNEWRGRDASSGMAWAFESAEQHWADHDARQVDYWRTRSAAERLAQAAEYRLRRYGEVTDPSPWLWRLLTPGEH